MAYSRRAAFAVSFLVILGLTSAVPPAGAREQQQMPTFVVKAIGPSGQQAAALAKQLELLGNPRNAFGGLVYMSPNYGDLPMKRVTSGGDPDEGGRKVARQGFDLAAITKLQVPTAAALMQDVHRAFDSSKLDPGAFLLADGSVRPANAHTTFTFQTTRAAAAGRATAPVVPIDTQVNYRMTLNAGTPQQPHQVPLVGPGAQVKVVQNPQGQVTELQYELRSLARGPMVGIIGPDEALQRCGDTLLPGKAGVASVSAKLVYYAPALEPSSTMPFPGSIRRVFPWYQCDGSVLVGDDTIGLRSAFVPAVAGMQVGVGVQELKAGEVRASAVVSGGAQPYSFFWSSSTGSIDPATATGGSRIDYQVVAKEQEQPTSETACVLVTDANGLTASQCGTTQLSGATFAPAAPAAARQIPRLDFGTEYIGTSAHLVGLQDLTGSAPNASGFRDRLNGSATSEFFWSETNAWERDFKQPGIGSGQDSSYADDVDVAFYTGHASETGFAFSNTTHDDGTMSDTEAQWGDRDLEWLAIAACLILNRANVGGDWAARWGGSFQGLHFLLS
ncbi:MAG TPA: DUF6345 domain-containing protein, partial [Actinomycetota bacterium]|nr:DUF6345 domain-containing protein [Actinomycetota bacterium]